MNNTVPMNADVQPDAPPPASTVGGALLIWCMRWGIAVSLTLTGFGMLCLGAIPCLLFYFIPYLRCVSMTTAAICLSGLDLNFTYAQNRMPGWFTLGWSLWLMAGVVLATAGVFCLKRRYSLRGLLAAVLAAGALGAAPYFHPGVSGTPVAKLSIAFANPPATLRLDELRRRLQPDEALAEMPAALRKELDLQPGISFAEVQLRVHDPEEKPGLSCVLTFPPDVSDKRAETLADFYTDLLITLAREQGAAIQAHNHLGRQPHSVWPQWCDEWEKKRAPAPEAPTLGDR